MFGKTAPNSNVKRTAPAIDLTGVASDPVDESFDFAASIISIEDDDDSPDDVKSLIATSLDSGRSLVTISDHEADSAEDDGIVFVHENRPNYVTCSDCGSRVFSFALPAHVAFHRNSASSAKRMQPSQATRPTRPPSTKKRRRDP